MPLNKKREKVAQTPLLKLGQKWHFGSLFPTANNFSWVGIWLGEASCGLFLYEKPDIFCRETMDTTSLFHAFRLVVFSGHNLTGIGCLKLTIWFPHAL